MALNVVKIIDIPTSEFVSNSHQILSIDRSINKTRLIDSESLKNYLYIDTTTALAEIHQKTNNSFTQANSAYNKANSAYELANTNPYGIIGFYPGTLTSNALITMHIAAWNVFFPDQLANSKGICLTPPTATTNLNILVDGSYAGKISFTSGNSNASFISSGFIVNTNSILKIVGPETPDQTLSDITFTLVGSR